MVEESPCLIQSLSQPSDSSTRNQEVDPLRALTTSISFGRFVSDSSSWEKWSCFSNNRYLEEAEKISKPGLVAEKKALLEAHFKKIGHKKASTVTNDREPSNFDNSCTNSLMVLESSKTANQEVGDEMQEKGGPNVLYSDVERKESDVDMMGDVEMESKTVDTMEKVIQYKVSKPSENEGEHVSKQEKMPIVDHTDTGTLVSKQSFSSSKFTDIRASNLLSSIKLGPSHPNKEYNATQTSERTERVSLEKKRSTLKSLHMSVDYSSRFGDNCKKSIPTIQKTGDSKSGRTFSKISRDTSTRHRSPTRASVAGTLAQSSATMQLQKRIKPPAKPSIPRSTAKPQPQAIEIKPPAKPSIPRSTAKPQPQAIESTKRGHNRESPTLAPSSPFSMRCEERVAKRKEFFQKLEEKQKSKEAEKAHLQPKSKKKSDDDLKTARQSTNCSWKPSANSRLDMESPKDHVKKVPLTRPQTPKLEKHLSSIMVMDDGSRPLWRPDKINDVTEAKEKTRRTPIRSSYQMLTTKDNSRLDMESPKNHAKKVPLTRPQTPKLEKLLASSMVVDDDSRPFWRPDKINDATKAKEKTIRTPIRSSCSILKKNMKENGSPNIQRWL